MIVVNNLVPNVRATNENRQTYIDAANYKWSSKLQDALISYDTELKGEAIIEVKEGRLVVYTNSKNKQLDILIQEIFSDFTEKLHNK